MKKHQRQSKFTKWNKQDIRKIFRDPYVVKFFFSPLKTFVGELQEL